MSRTSLLFFVLLTGVLTPWLGLGLGPQLQLTDGKRVPVSDGERLYGSLGCAACHTQQLSPDDVAPDATRGWGPRRTVAADYAGDPAPPLGALRLGPDLSNLGRRHPDAAWQQAFLSEAHPGMPSYAFLFQSAAGPKLVAYLLSLDRTAPRPEAAP